MRLLVIGVCECLEASHKISSAPGCILSLGTSTGSSQKMWSREITSHPASHVLLIIPVMLSHVSIKLISISRRIMAVARGKLQREEFNTSQSNQVLFLRSLFLNVLISISASLSSPMTRIERAIRLGLSWTPLAYLNDIQWAKVQIAGPKCSGKATYKGCGALK